MKIEVPAPTAWPIVLAFGLTLVCVGFVTAASVSILGAVVVAAGAVGWFRQVLPVESHEWEPVVQEEIAIETSRESVERVIASGPAHLAAGRDLSDFRRCQRRSCRRCGNGRARRGLRDLERQRSLVSDEPPGSRTVSRDGIRNRRSDRNFQPFSFTARRSDSPADFAPGRPALRSNAADGSTAPDFVGRLR